MCYVAIATKVNNDRDELVENVIYNSFHDKAVSNGDGFGFVGLVGDDFEIKKTMWRISFWAR
jgi:hypothetical protein